MGIKSLTSQYSYQYFRLIWEKKYDFHWLPSGSKSYVTWHSSLLKKYRNNMNKTSSPLSRISANLKRRCWSKTECWIHLAIHCYYWLTISSCLYVFISLLSLVSCPFLGPNFLDGVYVSHLLPFIFSIITGTSVINQLSSLDFCGGYHCSFEIMLLGYS